MPHLIVTPAAVQGIAACRKFLEKQAPHAARHAAAVIRDHLHQIRDYPRLGHIYAGTDNRELIIPFGRTGYLVLYRYDERLDTVYVLAFKHQREAGY